jgi:hyperosmotically inducible protein
VRRLNRWLIALGSALMFISGSSPAEGPSVASDATITAAVQLVLWKEGSLAGTDIRIETAYGDVTLRGFANTMDDIAMAGRLARAVPGVRTVRNVIRVPVQPSRV